MFSRNSGKPAALLTASLLLICFAPAVTALMAEIDLGGGIDLTDDSGIYVTALSRFTGLDLPRIQQLYDLCPDKDDPAVVLFLANATGRSPGYILALRGQKMSWWEISEGMNVNLNDWFVPLTRNPRPPFSSLYQKWRVAGEGGPRLDLSDDDCRNLAAAGFLHHFFKVTIARAMEMRGDGQDLEKITANEVRRRQDAERPSEKDLADRSAS